MLSIDIVCVGKIKEKFFCEAILEYSKRLSKYCKLNIVELPDEKIPNNPSNKQLEDIKQKECNNIITHIKKDSFIIIMCMIIGGVLEFSLSLFQEKVFNSVSWDYSSFQVNFGGRTNLLYSFFWGFLGLCWIKFLYPSLSEQIEKVRPLTGKILTAVVSVVLVISMGISSFALLRQENRLKGVPPKNELEVLADKYYNDDYLKKVYPNMILKVQEGKDSSLQTGGSKE